MPITVFDLLTLQNVATWQQLTFRIGLLQKDPILIHGYTRGTVAQIDIKPLL